MAKNNFIDFPREGRPGNGNMWPFQQILVEEPEEVPMIINQSKATQERRKALPLTAFSLCYMYFTLLRNFPNQKYVLAQTVLTKYYSLRI